MKSRTIDLATYCPKNIKLLAGRDNGIEMRKELKLKESEDDVEIENIIINVPKYIKTITSSYILGLVGAYIEEYGEYKFSGKYTFICNSVTKNNIEMAIQYVITNKGV